MWRDLQVVPHTNPILKVGRANDDRLDVIKSFLILNGHSQLSVAVSNLSTGRNRVKNILIDQQRGKALGSVRTFLRKQALGLEYDHHIPLLEYTLLFHFEDDLYFKCEFTRWYFISKPPKI